MKILLLLASVTLALAQPKPDFSGTWKQDNARSEFGGLPAPISVVDTIVHKEPVLHLTESVVGPQGDSVTSEHDFSTDGRQQTGKSPKYRETNTARWDERALVFIYTRNYPDREAVIRERWTLSGNGKSLRKERSRPGPKGEVKQVFVLDKQ